MNAVYRTVPAAAPLFAAADVRYAMMKETLTSTEFQGKTEAEALRWLADEQRELMRLLFQSLLTLRGQAQALGPVVGADGVTRTHLRSEQSRKLESVFGTVEAECTGYTGSPLSEMMSDDVLPSPTLPPIARLPIAPLQPWGRGTIDRRCRAHDRSNRRLHRQELGRPSGRACHRQWPRTRQGRLPSAGGIVIKGELQPWGRNLFDPSSLDTTHLRPMFGNILKYLPASETNYVPKTIDS